MASEIWLLFFYMIAMEDFNYKIIAECFLLSTRISIPKTFKQDLLSPCHPLQRSFRAFSSDERRP